MAEGFEHSVANMYFFPVALFHDAWDAPAATATSASTTHVTWKYFLVDNLIPVAIGNIVGGAVLVGLVYWFVYLRDSAEAKSAT